MTLVTPPLGSRPRLREGRLCAGTTAMQGSANNGIYLHQGAPL